MSCDCRAGGQGEKDMMTCWLAPGGGFELCPGCLFYDTSCSCQGTSTKQWNEEHRPKESHKSHGATSGRSLPSFHPPPANLFSIRRIQNSTHRASLQGLLQALRPVLIEIIVWYEAKLQLSLSSYSYHRVIGWHSDSSEISQGAECWKCVVARHSGSNPHRTSTLLETPCCVLSTASVIVELYVVWCSRAPKIARWQRC